jgi:hypothetical protein
MTQPLTGPIETVSHQVDRLTIQIDDSFDGFRSRYERAVPVFQSERFDSLVEHGVDWQTFCRPPQTTRHTTSFSTGLTTSRR